MARSKVSPLDHHTPIVDDRGCPTLQFLRLWQQSFLNEEDTATAVTVVNTTVADLDLNKADKTTVINAGVALSGGGDLSADRTIDHDDTAVTPGTYGSSTDACVITVDQQGHITDITEATISGGGGSSGTPTVRASNIQSSSTNSYTVTWPTGTIAGDVVVIFAGHGFSIDTPSGWLPLDTSAGSNWNGKVIAKVMTSADITAGSVTVTTAGAFNGVLAAVTLTGTTVVSYISIGFTRSSSGATSVSTAPALYATDTDLCLVFLSNRANNTADCTNTGASSLQTVSATDASGCVESVTGDASVFGFTGTGTFSSSGTGYYIAAVVFRG